MPGTAHSLQPKHQLIALKYRNKEGNAISDYTNKESLITTAIKIVKCEGIIRTTMNIQGCSGPMRKKKKKKAFFLVFHLEY